MNTPKQLVESRIQLHYAVQFIAATGTALGEPQLDGSQMTFDWYPEVQNFIGVRIPGAHACYVALDPVTLTSLILDDQQRAIASLPLQGQTLAAALAWHKAELAPLGIEPHPIALLSYPDDFPDHPLAQGAAFGTGDAADRRTLVNYFAQTRPLLQDIVTSNAGASPVHIWPHHFDMATLITLQETGETAQTIGVGFSPGDATYPQPYWYVTPWPYPAPEALPPLAIGIWHTAGWIGSILQADDLSDRPSETTQSNLQAFLQEAVSTCYRLLEA